MSFSYSRLNLYLQCPRKWYLMYIGGMKEPNRSYFTVGTICHRIAELSAKFCYRQTFINKAKVFYYKSDKLKELNKDNDDTEVFVGKIFDDKSIVKNTIFNSFANLMYIIDNTVDPSEYEMVSMPSQEIYREFFNIAVVEEKCNSPEILEECRRIMDRFYNWIDFSTLPGEIMLAEQKIAYDKSWNKVPFLDDNAYFRGVVDNIMYTSDKHVIIGDYKTSRTMLTKDQISEDNQLRCYVKMVVLLLGRANVNRITVRLIYARFCEIVEYTFTDDEIDMVVKDVGYWIDSTANEIESCGSDIDNFQPARNEYCNRCFIREELKCPLFVRKESAEGISLIVSNEVTCMEAWKRSEVLRDEYESLQGMCKEFIENTDGVVIIDDTAILDKHMFPTKVFIPEEVVSLALRKKIKLKDILPHLSVSDKGVKKLFKKLDITAEEYDKLYRVGKRSTFKALTPKEIDEE